MRLRTGIQLRLWIGAGLMLLVALSASAPAWGYQAVIRRTEGGIPHIKADSFANLGFGFGYAFAEDNICTMAEDYVTVDAQRSRFFGPNGSYQQRGNGQTFNNLNSDFFWQQIIDSHIINRLVARDPPLGPEPEIKRGVAGYVAGYNQYLADVGGASGVPDPRCRGKAWVRPITTADAYRRFYQLILLASQDVAVDGIGGAQPPPGGGTASQQSEQLPSAQQLAAALRHTLGFGGMGSNAIAVGSAGTRDHSHGLLLGNPHFPWIGPERFYQFQYTLPDKVTVSGATLFGVPLVLIGYTPTMAWSHTVSTAFRFTPYQLTLVSGDPTSYLVDGKPEKMTTRTVTVQVRQADGSLKPASRTLYSTRWGPVMTSLAGIPLPWTDTTAFTMADANVDNFRVFNHFFETDQARSAAQELQILKKYQGIPWVNTIVADKWGHSLYADVGSIPHVTDGEAKRCNTPLGAALFEAARLPVLDGSRSSCKWGTDPDSVKPGIFGPSHEPYLFRRDYVENSNDSYWLSNPHQPLTGFARIIGDENTARSLRTRMGLIQVEDRLHGRDGLGPPGFTRRNMQDIVFDNRVYAGELTRDSLVDMCRQFQATGGYAPTSSGPPVPVGNACDALAGWDLRANNQSRGALLFRQFWNHASNAEPSPWLQPFDPSDPINTPNTLNTFNPQVRTALGDAIADLRAANVPLAAPLGATQKVTWAGSTIPIHGGQGDPDGDLNAMYMDFDRSTGFSEPQLGSSYVQAVTWTDGSCPNAATILTYSLSENPNSPHRADQTLLYSQKKWLPARFCETQIAASPALTVEQVSGGAAG